MSKIMNLKTTVLLLACGLTCACAQAQEDAKGIEFFEKKIRPVLARECYGCHSSQSGKARGGLKLDTQNHSHLGGDSGPAIVPGDLDDSLLWSAINYDDFQMPPNKPLSPAILRDFREWILMGAPDPRVETIEKIDSQITPEDIEAGRNFWAFVAPVSPEIPAVNRSSWPVTDIDKLVLAKLESNGLRPAVDTDPNSLLRRLCIDLIGLPPSLEQISSFKRQWKKNPQSAVENVVDSLLEQPEFGERWGRHWLDVARYAESTGRELNVTFPTAWRYRDYVIDSFNDDKPYNRFLEEQIAGDLLPVSTDEQWAENIVATGFLALGPKTLTERNGRQFQLDLADEQIDVTTRVVLGISVACARCHDHKFDPIPQSDYYAMAGIFQNFSTHYGTLDTFQNRRPSDLLLLPINDPNPFDRKLEPAEIKKLKEEIADKRAEVTALQRERRQMRLSSNPNANNAGVNAIATFARASSELATLNARLNQYDEDGNPQSLCMGVQDKPGKPVNSRLLVRGEFDKPTDEIPRGFVQVVSRNQPEIPADSSGRLELAKWISADENPLTARVMANRVWLHLMGQGIVRTPENFGTTGQPPTHPELLDYLSVEFVKSDWSVKSLVRKIATSRIYRTSSEHDVAAFRVDPENKLYWRIEPKRLDAEVLRDSILMISGELDLQRPRASLVAYSGSGIVRDGQIIAASRNESMKSDSMKSDSMDSDSMRSGPGGSMRETMRRRFRQRAQNSSQYRNRNSMAPKENESKANTPKNNARPTPDQRSLGNFGATAIDQATKTRSAYLPVIRDDLPRAMEVFDFAEPGLVVGQRESSNTPDQGLFFMNNPFVIEQSQIMARRLVKDFESPQAQIEQAYRLAFGRDVTDRELRATVNFYREFETSSRLPRMQELERLSAICQAIIGSAEFRFVQ